jgi:hypothetical protein
VESRKEGFGVSKVDLAADRIEFYGQRMRAGLMRSGLGVEQGLRLTLGELKLRKPRLRKKEEVRQLEADIRLLKEALDEVVAAAPKETTTP